MSHENRLKTTERYIEQPSEAAEGLAYWLNDCPERADETVARLDGKLADYQEVKQNGSNDLAIEHAINRSLCMVTSAPLYFMMELEADRRFLKAYTSDGLDVETYTEGLPWASHYYPFAGGYKQFSDISETVNRAAAVAVLDQLQDKDHPYRRTWELFGLFLPEFARTEVLVRGHKRSPDPGDAITAAFSDLGGDTILKFLMQAVFHFRDVRGLRGGEITQALLYRAEELSWAARTKRTFFGPNFPDAGEQPGTSPSCPFKPTGKRTFSGGQFGDRSALWQREDMYQAIKEISGFCPAAVDLKSIWKEGRLIVESMHGLVENATRERLMSRLYGTSTAAELSLIRSILLLDKTLIKTF